MTATNAMIGKGTTLGWRDAGTADAYVNIGELKDLEVPPVEVGMEDVTTHDSANDTHEYVPTTIEPGSLSAEINYSPTLATHKNAAGGLYDSAINKRKKDFKVTYKNGSVVTFTGYISKFGPVSAPVKGIVTAPIEIKVTGLPTFP